jgi:hypothetical protein
MSDTMTTKTLGQVAWETYGRSEKDQGLMRPAKEYRWKDLDGVTQSLWNAAAQAVAAAVRAETEEVVQAAEAFYEADAKWQSAKSSEYEDAEQERGRRLDSMLSAIARLRARRGTP